MQLKPVVGWKQFFRDLKNEMSEDNVSTGAAALAYYLTLAIFPSMIFLLTLIPYLPIENLDREVMSWIGQALPGETAEMFSGVVTDITRNKRGGLLSLGLLGTLWAAQNGTYAVIQQLNIAYDVKEGRRFFKVRGAALGLTLLLGILMVSACALAVIGGTVQDWAGTTFGLGDFTQTAFTVFRWSVIVAALFTAFAVTYYFGPDVEQDFKFITPGSIGGVTILVGATLLFRFYVTNFGNYSATYGSIGAVIVLMLWLYITGLVMLIGSEINALYEHYHPQGKNKGEKEKGDHVGETRTPHKLTA